MSKIVIHKTIVVNVKVAYIRPQYNNLKEWCADKTNLYIGRKGIVFIDGERYPKQDSPWANPFKISDDLTRDDVVNKYRKYILTKLKKDELNIKDIRHKRLGCWCVEPNKDVICHGHILIDILRYYLIHHRYPDD